MLCFAQHMVIIGIDAHNYLIDVQVRQRSIECWLLDNEIRSTCPGADLVKRQRESNAMNDGLHINYGAQQMRTRLHQITSTTDRTQPAHPTPSPGPWYP
jgi:hypothetical protein